MPQDGRLPEPPRPRGIGVPSAVLAVLVLVFTEIMFFAGLLSAFVIVKAGIKPGMWPPPWQPRLPVEGTAVNTAILLLSGVLLLLSGVRRFRREQVASRALFVTASVLGAFFVLFQGFEWTRLLKEGLTLVSSNHGAFFYLIVGTHALHVVGALSFLGWGLMRLLRGTLEEPQLRALQIFWTFVVGLWPVLYVLVYL